MSDNHSPHDDSGSLKSYSAKRLIAALVAWILVSAILVLHARYYMPFIADDALISLRYVDRLLDGFGLTWTDGKPVEGYSNLLWILIIAVPGLLRFDLIDSVRILGIAATTLGIGAFFYNQIHSEKGHYISTILGSLVFAFSAPIAVWAIGGLEQPLVAMLLIWATILMFRTFEEKAGSSKYIWHTSIFLALLCLSRPDGCLFTVAFVLAAFLTKGIKFNTFTTAIKLALLPLLFFAGQMIFRILYYGEWLPNPALVKISGSLYHMKHGLSYLWQGFLALLPFSAIAILFIIIGLIFISGFSIQKRRRIILLMFIGLIWSGYIIYVGGDIFPAYRLITPLIVLMSLLIAECTDWLAGRIKSRTEIILILGLFAPCMAYFVYVQFTDIENYRAKIERWEWGGQVVGTMLKDGFGEQQPLIGVTAAGCLPYWSKLPTIDMLGLNDYYIPRHPPARFGTGILGHEMGDGRYVFSRNPDLVILSGPYGAYEGRFRSGIELMRMHEFRKDYTPTVFEGHGTGLYDKIQSIIWVKKSSEKIGIQYTDTLITVPGYFLNANRNSIVSLNKNNQFVIILHKDKPVGITDLRIPAGSWQMDVEPDADITTSVKIKSIKTQSEKEFFRGSLPAVLKLDNSENLTIMLRPIDSLELEVESLLFKKL